MLDAINLATGTFEKFPLKPAGTRAISLPDTNYPSYFLDTFGRPERAVACECERATDPTMSQALRLMNGDLLNRKLTQADGRLARLLRDPKLTDETLVETLYVATFNRLPTSQENEAARRLITEAPTRPSAPRTYSTEAHELQRVLVQPLIKISIFDSRSSSPTRPWNEPFRRSGHCPPSKLVMVGSAHPTIASTPREQRSGFEKPQLTSRVTLGLILLTLVIALSPSSRGDEGPTYEQDIKPLFTKRCTVCHNKKKLENLDISGGLALDTFDAALGGTNAQKVIVPGRSGASELIKRLNETDEDTRMPLLEKPLPEAERDLVRRWIDAGAPRGVEVADTASSPKPAARRIVRSLDLVLGVERKDPTQDRGIRPGVQCRWSSRSARYRRSPRLAFRGDGRQLAGEPAWRGPDLGPGRRSSRGSP